MKKSEENAGCSIKVLFWHQKRRVGRKKEGTTPLTAYPQLLPPNGSKFLYTFCQFPTDIYLDPLDYNLLLIWATSTGQTVPVQNQKHSNTLQHARCPYGLANPTPIYITPKEHTSRILGQSLVRMCVATCMWTSIKTRWSLSHHLSLEMCNLSIKNETVLRIF